MSMMEWAKKEIEIACQKERGGRDPSEWDYGCACYESALKAFESLCEDNHSGMSIGFTKHILNRLIDGKCLTPIEDTPDIWSDCTWSERKHQKKYQCKRMSSLFKTVYSDGTIKYSDAGRVIGHSYGWENGLFWSSRRIIDYVDNMFPITMPYMPPDKRYVIEMVDFKLNFESKSDLDTEAWLWLITPDGEKIDILNFQALDEDTDSFVPISKDEFFKRLQKYNKRAKPEEVINLCKKDL